MSQTQNASDHKTTVGVHKRTRDRLYLRKRKGETFDDVVERLLNETADRYEDEERYLSESEE